MSEKTIEEQLAEAVRERDEADGRYQSEHCHRLSLQSEVDAVRAVLGLVEDQLEEAEAKLKSGEAEWATRRCECSADETCKFVRERDEARAEVERLRAETAPMNEHFTAGYRDGYQDAYRRGAEAMREHIAEVAWRNAALEWFVELVRALPIPEEP